MDNIKRIIIGTANFGQEYNGVRAKNVDRILEYAMESGIEYLDCATAYNYTPPQGFWTINKITSPHQQRIGSYATLIHHAKEIPVVWPVLWELKFGTLKMSGKVMKIGLSIYEPEEINCLPFDVIQLPYRLVLENKINLKDLKMRGIEVHVRKVFADKCFEQALKDPYVDKVIIGVDNLEQLKENVKIVEKL